jgi:ELWxxDGT repeat protein
MRSMLLSFSLPALATLALAGRAHAQTPYLVKDIDPSGSGVTDVVGAAGDRLVFNGSGGLWSTEGTEASTVLIHPDLSLFGALRLEPGDKLVARRLAPPPVTFTTDGTAAGTVPLSLLGVCGNYVGVARGGFAVYLACGDWIHPWITDGSASGTSSIPVPVGFNRLINFFQPEWVDGFRGSFAMVMRDEFWGDQIWLYDPVSRRTSLVDRGDHNPGPGDFIRSIKGLGERLFISRQSGLWVSAGSASTTRFVEDVPGLGTQMAFRTVFVTLGDHVYFLGEDGGPRRLWRSDGTPAGTVPFSSIAPATAGLETVFAAGSGTVLYFIASSPAQGRELWRTDGTASGTFLLKDIDPGPGSGIQDPLLVVPVAGGLVFRAGTAATGQELWWTDGTPAGTVALPEIAPGPEPALGGELFRAGNRVYTKANDGVHGDELWAVELPAGAVAVDDAVATEGVGPTSVRFAVRLESAADHEIVVSYTTVAGTALPGSDFVPQAGSLTFAPGVRTAFVDVAIVDDAVGEPDESFELAVTSVTGAPVSDGRAFSVVRDDDGGARIVVAGTSVVEGNGGPVDAVFPVTLTTADGRPTPHAVTVRAGVINRTAGDEDFPPSPAPPKPPVLPIVTFPAGSPSGTTLPLAVPIQGDTLDEPNETFSLEFDALNDALVPEPGTVGGVILDDDGIAAAPPVEIGHGSRITADLTPPVGRASDVDFYVLRHDLHSSYEIVVDAVSGDAMPLQVERVVADGGVFQTALATGTGNSVAMRFFGLGVSTDHIRVRSAACGTTCGPDDVYRLRMYETTLRSPRVNTVDAQATALLVQNTTDAPIAAVAAYWSAAGVMSSVQMFDVPAHGVTVVDVTAVLLDFSGSVTVGHNGPYGGLVGKVVSIDPATGFSFESPLSAKPR